MLRVLMILADTLAVATAAFEGMHAPEIIKNSSDLAATMLLLLKGSLCCVVICIFSNIDDFYVTSIDVGLFAMRGEFCMING